MGKYLSFVFSVFFVASSFAKDSGEKKERAFVVETESIKAQPFAIKRKYIGTINAENFSLLQANAVGTVSAILVKPGAFVKKDQLLVSLDNAMQKASFALAKQSYESLNAELSRLQTLQKSGDATKAQVDRAERELLASSISLEASKKSLENTEIRASFDGYAGVPRVVLGESLKPGSPVISLKKGPYSFKFLVPASRLRELKLGQKIEIGKQLISISAIENIIDPKTQTGFAKAEFASCDDCIVGESVFGLVEIANQARAILIDKNAFFYDKGKAYAVAVVEQANGEKRAEHREIKLGQEHEGKVEILSGLAEGEEIVSSDPKRIFPKTLVRVIQ